MKRTKPTKPILDAINDLEIFLESDLYSKFRPEERLPTGKKGKIQSWYRKDVFPNKKEFVRYIKEHFDILRKQIKEKK